MHKARPVTLSPTGDARPEVAESSPTREPTIRQDPGHPTGRRISKAAGSRAHRKNVSPAGTRYRDLGDGRRHMATGMHGSEPAEDIVVDALRSTRYHVSPSRGDCRDACAIRSDTGVYLSIGDELILFWTFRKNGKIDR